jgi:hypothetical protein
MPDWTYHTVLRPAASLLPRGRVRPLVLNALAAIARLPGGGAFIHLLGQMDPPAPLAREVAGLKVTSPVGLGGGVDPDGLARDAFARFGFGVIELGPYALGSADASALCPPPLVPGARPPRLEHRPGRARVLIRLVLCENDEQAVAQLGEVLAPIARHIDGVCLTIQDTPDSTAFLERAASACRSAGVSRVLFDGQVTRGLSTPRQIADAIASGAGLVLVDTGFIKAGPGLAKRANEAIAGQESDHTERRSSWRDGWPWVALLGVGMTVAGLVVLGVGLTRITLPYDESFLGLSHNAIAALNPHLLAFMKHDRVTLAGTMVSLGILYAGLAWGGMRRGLRWARSATLASGGVGFAGIFLFLGFHYVDPLHVALAVVLFPLFLAGVILKTEARWPRSRDLDNDRVWRTALWGQLCFVALGAGLTVAGLVIAAVGVTGVFVWSDLQFLGTTSEALSRANSHLLPLIAHDRAGFGGALASDGVGILLLALWGFRRGEPWVWWTLLFAGLAGFLGGVYAHVAVGYLEFGHLLPLAASGAIFVAGLVLSAPYLLAAPKHESVVALASFGEKR